MESRLRQKRWLESNGKWRRYDMDALKRHGKAHRLCQGVNV
jgi:hypothetical protein